MFFETQLRELNASLAAKDDVVAAKHEALKISRSEAKHGREQLQASELRLQQERFNKIKVE